MATFAKSSFSANNYYDMARQQRQFPQGVESASSLFLVYPHAQFCEQFFYPFSNHSAKVVILFVTIEDLNFFCFRMIQTVASWYKPNMPKCSYPVEVFFSGSNLEMILGYAQVHLSIADDGESFFSVYQMTTIFHSDILK